MTTLVTFRLGEREYATTLVDVREVVRLQGLTDLPGMTAPMAGVIDLRGATLAVLDLRSTAEPGEPGDVLVMERRSDGSLVGIAVDQVRAVVASEELAVAGAPGRDEALPAYVVGVLRGPHGVVFLVDLPGMVAAVVPARQ